MALILALLACTPVPAPIPPPIPDASDAAAFEAGPVIDASAPADVFDIACMNLATLGCPEGSNPGCAVLMRTAQLERVTDYAPSCVATKKTAAEIRACSPAWKNGCRGARTAP